jgi:hypothetical protein
MEKDEMPAMVNVLRPHRLFLEWGYVNLKLSQLVTAG